MKAREAQKKRQDEWKEGLGNTINKRKSTFAYIGARKDREALLPLPDEDSATLSLAQSETMKLRARTAPRSQTATSAKKT